jgi:hypothetical protein
MGVRQVNETKEESEILGGLGEDEADLFDIAGDD